MDYRTARDASGVWIPDNSVRTQSAVPSTKALSTPATMSPKRRHCRQHCVFGNNVAGFDDNVAVFGDIVAGVDVALVDGTAD